ncbi:Lactose operon repressor [Microbacterium sp. MM2322]|uniref:LacI family DNA-binding transcriptional regulator n=1 Tax=unclassified Microbacterium TaxID=2609290 RepID=UPI0017817498|nr:MULTISPECIES: LacI family DNA-binding transcriptional regulator [unclassified Microbacterium]MBD8207393.1 LacI family DNA-binding transcriptional regulator [Microbacterium sp. CFBP 8801]MBD8217222.1 LacI family DNA-binding transcriptional regulator [Microbacterium sp. CFBP 13617]MBD8477249.1 LacI family DNA-binding transcriptional regulator [Microbacterium sp. CFBP 8794]MBD8508914.1 LacI family DNA-binding transcriptional regulator [Microbacterium sp. CFBP 8790]
MPQSSSRGWQRPSIYDVARRAGVSHMTVSRVLNAHPNIRETTRTRVLQAIDEMNYTPSSIARALATRRARRIGVLIDGPVQNGPNSTLRALEIAAREVGYAVSAFSIGDDDASQMDSGVVELVTQGVDALCVIAPRESSLDLLRQQATGLPTIVIKAEADESWHTVGVDQRAGARLAVDHLVGLGHRTIAHLAGPLDWLDARERVQGWRKSLAEAGLPEGPYVIGDWTSDFGFEFGRSFDLGETTAVFAANDQIALGVVHGLHSRGLRVPDDVSVVGFDDLSDARHFLPPLTTVRQDFAALGKLALQQIIAAIEGDIEPSHDMIQPNLIVRESTQAVTPR